VVYKVALGQIFFPCRNSSANGPYSRFIHL